MRYDKLIDNPIKLENALDVISFGEVPASTKFDSLAAISHTPMTAKTGFINGMVTPIMSYTIRDQERDEAEVIKQLSKLELVMGSPSVYESTARLNQFRDRAVNKVDGKTSQVVATLTSHIHEKYPFVQLHSAQAIAQGIVKATMDGVRDYTFKSTDIPCLPSYQDLSLRSAVGDQWVEMFRYIAQEAEVRLNVNFLQ